MDNKTPMASTDLCYPVLTPFKFKGQVVKPPAFVQMSAEQAAPYLAEQVIGEDAALPPEPLDKTIAPETTPPTVVVDPAAGVPAAGKTRAKSTPGEK